MSEGAWHPDPTGRFAQRYHDGQAWTDHVVDAAGAQQTDAVAPADAPTATSASASAGPAVASAGTKVAPPQILSGVGLLLVAIAMFGFGWLSVSMSAGPERFDETFDRSDISEAVSESLPPELQGFGAGSALPEPNLPTDLYFSFGWLLALAAAGAAVGASSAPGVTAQLRMIVAGVCGFAAVWHLVALLGAASYIDALLDSVMGGVGLGASLLNLDVSVAIGGWIGLLGLVLAAVGAAMPRPLS